MAVTFVEPSTFPRLARRVPLKLAAFPETVMAFQHHLGVNVDRFDASSFPHLT